MILNLKISGDDMVVESALEMFVSHHGWKEESGVLKLQYAETTIKRFIRESIDSEAVRLAKISAEQYALAQIGESLQNVTTVLTEEEQ